MRLTHMLAGFIACFGQPATSQVVDRSPSQIQVERLSGALGAVPTNLVPRPLNPVSLELIKHFEGWSAFPYDDSAGYCTIGYGHLIALKRCSTIDLGAYAQGISKEQGLEILEKDTALARIVVQTRLKTEVSSDSFGALTSFVFNVGEGRFVTSTLFQLVQANQIDLASKQFGRWVRAGKKVQNGLVIRRRCESTLFLSRLELTRLGTFDRARCIALGIASSAGESIDILKGERY